MQLIINKKKKGGGGEGGRGQKGIGGVKMHPDLSISVKVKPWEGKKGRLLVKEYWESREKERKRREGSCDVEGECWECWELQHGTS